MWTDRNGEAKFALDMVAHAVLSAYHVKRKRQAMQPGVVSKATTDGTAHGGYGDMQDAL